MQDKRRSGKKRYSMWGFNFLGKIYILSGGKKTGFFPGKSESMEKLSKPIDYVERESLQIAPI